MNNIIKALNIFLKYKDIENPIHCEEEQLWICGYDNIDLSEEDNKILHELGFVKRSDAWIFDCIPFFARK